MAWFTSKSRYETGLCHCPRLRYLRYHHGGKGIERKWTSIPLSAGKGAHKCIELALKYARDNSNEAPGRATMRGFIRQAIEEYKDEVAGVEISGVADEYVKFVVAEQCCLIEGMAWGWYRMSLPSLLEQFEILHVEEPEEMTLDADKQIILRNIPDLVARRKADGALTDHDFKTAGSISDYWAEQYKDSIQMGTGLLTIEARMGERIQAYYLHGIVRGGRGIFKHRGRKDKHDKQYSHFCYAKFHPPQPPLVRHETWSNDGFWIDKTPVWEADLVGLKETPAQTNAEVYVMNMSKAELAKLYVMAGPFPRPDKMIASLPTEIRHEEIRWMGRIKRIQDLGDAEEILDALVPRSYDCYKYGSRCEFYRGCRLGDWSGDYKEREPFLSEEETSSDRT